MYPEALQNIYSEYAVDPRFEHLREPGINLVGGHGPLNPRLMLIGEAPGKMENARLIPFIGSAGHNLTIILTKESIDIKSVFLTNVLKYWPKEDVTNNDGFTYSKTRTPTDEEITASREYITREIEAVNPAFIGLCGRTATGALFPQFNRINTYNGSLIEGRFVPLFHPSVISYNPDKAAVVQSGYHKLANYMKDSEAA